MGNVKKTFLTQMYTNYKGNPTLTTVYTDGSVEFPTGEESHLTPTQHNLVYQKLSEAKEQRATKKMEMESMERKLHEYEKALARAKKKVQELEEGSKKAQKQEESDCCGQVTTKVKTNISKKDKVATFKVMPRTWEDFTAICKAQGMSNSSVINMLISDYIREYVAQN